MSGVKDLLISHRGFIKLGSWFDDEHHGDAAIDLVLGAGILHRLRVTETGDLGDLSSGHTVVDEQATRDIGTARR